MTTDPHVLGPGLLPTPFTAAEIREATGRGKTIRLLVERPGRPARRARQPLPRDGCRGRDARPLGHRPTPRPSRRAGSTWAELQGHAAFRGCARRA